MIKVITYKHPVLRKKAQLVEITEDILRLAEEMKEALREEQGIGLAAPQVGVSKNVIVINTGDKIAALFNVEILKTSKEKTVIKEGCLSFPGVWLNIRRSCRIKIKALDEQKNKIELDAQGMMAVVLQHEIDHLHGKLFIDRANFWAKQKELLLYHLRKLRQR